MPSRTSRRQFLQTAAATSVGFWVAGGLRAAESKSPNEQLQVAAVGVDGKGKSDAHNLSRHGKMVAICDVDDNKLKAASKLYPDAKQYNDFRKMLEEMGDKIDAVTVSTPDHTHAPAAVMAMKMGKHCYCQKPLTHSIYEARMMGEVARKHGVMTQMGNQGTSLDSLREAAAIIKSGALGKLSEVHVWTNRPIWDQGIPRPDPIPVPPFLHWDLWIGPAPMRPFTAKYHPFAWRGWWDFGTGALGDMACHTVNLVFMGVDLADPTSVQAESSGHNKDSYPQRSKITFEFPANDWRGPLTMVWYDGGHLPDAELLDGEAPKNSGSLVIGEKGKLYSPGDYGGSYRLLGDIEKPEVEFEKAPKISNEMDENHMAEFVEAIKTGKQAKSNFPDYAGPLTETILLGNLAVWVAVEEGLGEKVQWGAKNLKVKNISGLETIVKHEYREGYTL